MARWTIVVVFLAGCVTQIKAVPRNWDRASDPKCTTDGAFVAGDIALALASAGTGIAIAENTADRKTAGEIALGGLVVGLVFAVGAAAGYDEVEKCRDATEHWRVATAVVQRDRARRAAKSTPPRGFFCANSPTVNTANLCARERATCEQARNAAVAAVPDLGSCALVEVAWCFQDERGVERCSGAETVCDAQRDAVLASGEVRTTIGACVEIR